MTSSSFIAFPIPLNAMDNMVIDGGTDQDCILVFENQIYFYDNCGGGAEVIRNFTDVEFADPHIYVSSNEILIIAQNSSPSESLHIWAITLDQTGEVTSNQRIPITSTSITSLYFNPVSNFIEFGAIVDGKFVIMYFKSGDTKVRYINETTGI